MGLETKSNENFQIAELCKRKNHYNGGASRAYYAVFQKFKGYLIKMQFDGDEFIRRRRPYSDDPFAHGNIRLAVIDYLVINCGKTRAEIKIVNRISDLYRKRLLADYEDEMIGNFDLIKSIEDAEKIIDFIDLLDEEDE
jgi:hypothetical protein